MGSICGGGGSSSQTTTQANSPPPQVQADYQGVVNRATAVANTPYTPYPGEQVAPLSNQTNTGLANLNQYAYAAQPYLNQAGQMVNTGAGMNQTAAGMTQAAAAPVSATQFSGSQVGQYENPFTQDVIQATQNQFNNQNKQQAQFLNSQNIGAGAFGGDRAGVSQAVLAGQQQASQAPVIAGLNQANYNQALAEFNNQQQTNLGTSEFNAQQLGQMANQYGNLGTGYANLGGDYGNVGTGIQNAGVSGANQQIQGGMIPQTEQQAIDTAGLNNWNQGQAYPFQSTSFLGNMIEGIGSQSGGTAATTTPGPSPVSQALGAGTAIAGIAADLLPFSDIRTKENVVPVGKTFDGQTIHRFNYKGDPRSQIGLVAQEVERSHPDAVHKGLGGLRHLDYEAATRDAERGGFDGGGGVSPGSTYDLGVGKFSPSGALALMDPSSGAGAGTGSFGAGNLIKTPGGTIFGQGPTPVTGPVLPPGSPPPPTPSNPLPAAPSRQGYGPYTPAQPGPMLRPTAGVPSQAHGGRINRDIGGPTGLGNATFSGIPNLGFIDYSTPTAIAQGTGVPGPYSGLANIAFSSASQGGGSSDSVGGQLFGFNTLSPSQPNLSGAAPGTTFKPIDYQDPGANFQTAGAEASLGPHYFTTGKNGELVFGGQGTAPAGTAGATNLGELLSRPGGNLPTDTAKTENPPPPAAAAAAPAPAAAAADAPTRGVTVDRYATNPNVANWYASQAHGGPGAGASGGGAGAGAWTGGRTNFQSGGFSGLDDPRYSYYTPMTGNARGAAYHPPVPSPSPSPSPIRPPIIRHIAPRPAPVRIPPTVRAQAPALPPPRPTAPPPAAQPPMPLPDVTFPLTPERQFTAPRSVADPMSGTSGPSSGIAPYHSLLPSMGGPRGYTNDYPSDPDPDRAAGLGDLRDQLNERPGFNSGGVMGQWPLAAATGYTPQGQGITGFDSQGSSMGAGSVAKSAGAGFGDLFDGGSKASRTGFADGGDPPQMPFDPDDKDLLEGMYDPPSGPQDVMGPAEMYSRQHEPWKYRPSYGEGESPGFHFFPEGGARPPAPPPALTYPGNAKNVFGRFRSSQFASRPPILSSTNMPPAGRYAPAKGFSPGLNNYMNLVPSTDLARGGRTGFADGGLSGLGMMPSGGVDPALQAVLQINSADPFKGLQPLPIGHGPPTPAEPKAQQASQPFDSKGLGDSISKLMGAFKGGGDGLDNLSNADFGDVASGGSAVFSDLPDDAFTALGDFEHGGAVNGRVGAWGGPGAGASGSAGTGAGGGASGGDGGAGGGGGASSGGAGGDASDGGDNGFAAAVAHAFGVPSATFGTNAFANNGEVSLGGVTSDATNGYNGVGYGGGATGPSGGTNGSGGGAGGVGGATHGLGSSASTAPGTPGFVAALNAALAAIRSGGGPSTSDVAALESAIRQGQIGFSGDPGVASLGVPGAMGGDSSVTGAAPSSPVSVSNIMAAAAAGVSNGMSPAAAIAAAEAAAQRGYGGVGYGGGSPSATVGGFRGNASPTGAEGVSTAGLGTPRGSPTIANPGGDSGVAGPSVGTPRGSPAVGTPGGLSGVAGAPTGVAAAPSVANVAPSFSFDARGNMIGGGSQEIPAQVGHGGRYRGGRTSFGLGGVTRPGFFDGGVGPGPPQPPEPADPAPVVAAPAPDTFGRSKTSLNVPTFDPNDTEDKHMPGPSADGVAPEGGKPTRQQLLDYNASRAPKYGLNPDVVTKVLGGEMGAKDPYQVGDAGSSFGPWQLHKAGINPAMNHPGMGDDYFKATGHDPNDPRYWQEQSDFALKGMSERGLQPWQTTAGKLGLGRWAARAAGGDQPSGGGSALAYAGGDSNGGNPPDQNQQQTHMQAAMDDAARPPDQKLLPPGVGDSLMAAGFAMMAGTSPHAMVNIGQGALAGMKYYQSQRQLDREWQKNEAQIQDWQSQAKYRDAQTALEVQQIELSRFKLGPLAEWAAGGMQGPMPQFKPSGSLAVPGASTSAPAPTKAAPTAAPAPVSAATPAPGAPAVAGSKPIPVVPGALVGAKPVATAPAPAGAPPVVASAPSAPAPTATSPDAPKPASAAPAPAGDEDTVPPEMTNDPDWQKNVDLIAQGKRKNAGGKLAGIEGMGDSDIEEGERGLEAVKARFETQKAPYTAKIEAQKAGYQEYQKSAEDFNRGYENSTQMLSELSKIYKGYRSGTGATDISDVAGFADRFGLGGLMTQLAPGWEKAGHDAALKTAVDAAFQKMQDTGSGKAPRTALQEALLTSPTPTNDPAANWKIVTETQARLHYAKDMIDGVVSGDNLNIPKAEAKWMKTHDNLDKYRLEARKSTPLFMGMTPQSYHQVTGANLERAKDGRVFDRATGKMWDASGNPLN